MRWLVIIIRRNLRPGVSVKEVLSWACFDFANSGFSTVVITAVFSAYFVSVIAEGAPWATLLLTLALSISYVMIMLSAPVLGVFADARRSKKKFLIFTTVGCCFFTGLLSLTREGDIAMSVLFIILANFFFGTGENLIAAFLPELAKGRSIGKVSGWGWAIGYLGGLLTLVICLVYLISGLFENAVVSGTMVITAVIFLIASVPTFWLLKERGVNKRELKLSIFSGFKILKISISKLSKFPDLKNFLFCLLIYQAGVQAVITLAAVYADQAMQFSTTDTIVLILVVNITACFGALIFGQIEDRIGHKNTLFLTLLGWLLTVLVAYASIDRTVFWIAANLAGFSLGASQSAGRAMVAFFSPKNKEGEFLGLWGLAVKGSSILGPMSYGLVVWLTNGNHRQAILTLIIYFLLGMVILSRIDVNRGRQLVTEQKK